MFVDNGHLCLTALHSAVLMRNWERLWDWQLFFGMVRLSCISAKTGHTDPMSMFQTLSDHACI